MAVFVSFCYFCELLFLWLLRVCIVCFFVRFDFICGVIYFILFIYFYLFIIIIFFF